MQEFVQISFPLQISEAFKIEFVEQLITNAIDLKFEIAKNEVYFVLFGPYLDIIKLKQLILEGDFNNVNLVIRCPLNCNF